MYLYRDFIICIFVYFLHRTDEAGRHLWRLPSPPPLLKLQVTDRFEYLQGQTSQPVWVMCSHVQPPTEYQFVPLFLLLGITEKCLAPSSLLLLIRYLKTLMRSSPEPSPLQSNQCLLHRPHRRDVPAF